jgi:hypothetical protein
MSEVQEQGSRGGGWLIWIFLAAVLYVLSVGPAGALALRNPSLQTAFYVAYYPLRLLIGTPLSRPLEAYCDLWHR